MNRFASKKKKPVKNDARVFAGGVNVFAALGRPDADDAFAKVELAYRIHALIQQKGLTQIQAARLLNTDPARVSNIGLGPSATPTKKAGAFEALPTESMSFPLHHPPHVDPCSQADEVFSRRSNKAA